MLLKVNKQNNFKIVSNIFKYVYPLLQISHRLLPPLPRRPSPTKRSLYADPPQPEQELGEPGKSLTSHLHATERRAGGLIQAGV